MSYFRRILRKLKLLPAPVSNPVKRMDLIEIPICENLSFLVYWKILNIGKGPAVIMKAFDKEILKFDCFGEKDGHFHIAPHYDFRIYFLENTVDAQIKRTINELKFNGLKYVSLQPDPRVRVLNPDPKRYNLAILEVENQMTYFHKTIKEIQ